MTDTLKERITRVARIAQRNARNHEDQQEAQALLDELATFDAVDVMLATLPGRAAADAQQKAVADSRDAALANAAMVAHDMGHPDVRKAINRLMPDGSPHIPMDDERSAPTAAVAAPVAVATADTAPATAPKPADKPKGSKR